MYLARDVKSTSSTLELARESRKIAAFRSIFHVVPKTEYVENFVLNTPLKCYSGRMKIVVDGISITRYRDILPGQAIIAQNRTAVEYDGKNFSVFYVDDMDYSSGVASLQIISRAEAAAIGHILVSKEFTRSSPIPSSADRPAKFEVWHPDPAILLIGWWLQPYLPINYFLRDYSPKGVFGKNIYIQSNEPTDPDCVWIDTAGIDLIQE